MSSSLRCFGNLSHHLLEPLQQPLQEVFGVPVTICETPLPLPTSGFSTIREQWLAKSLTKVLAASEDPTQGPETLRLGVTDEDLFATGLNFVFGEASAAQRCAVFSIARLDERFYGYSTLDIERFYERCATEAVHELGHVAGLGHCSRRSCVMWFSNTLQETDAKGWRPCDHCKQALQQAGWG